ncbi:hypothetical protein [Tissierella praeacuta]|uniref:hypothetical protein n=1 Tax=Tissierella praeacuta TaxID=43131 RepID=UPI00334133EE
MKKHKKILFICALSLILIAAACEKSKQGVSQKNNSYLSISSTKYVNGNDTNDGMETSIILFDIQERKEEKINSFDYTS